MFYHHNTIRTYTGALLNLFNDLEVQYKNSTGEISSRNIPIRFASKEKSKILDEYTTEQLTSGNYNVLPRASLSWSSLMKSDQRMTNKNVKINTKAKEDTFEFLYNSVPYEFTYELNIMCRGMNEATMIIEQIACKFNPIVNIDVYDATNLDEPTRIPVQLLDIGAETAEYEELSSNIINVSVGLSLKGNIYPPIKSIDRIKDFKMFINDNTLEKTIKKSVLSYDVVDSETVNGQIFIPEIGDTFPRIVEIVGTNVVVGNNTLICIFEDNDSTIRELTFEWFILSGDAVITNSAESKDSANLIVHSSGNIEVLCKITDENGNYNSKTKIFTIL